MFLHAWVLQSVPPATALAASGSDGLDMGVTFHEIAEKANDCKAEAETFDASSGTVSPTNIMHAGDCVDDALRKQAKVPPVGPT